MTWQFYVLLTLIVGSILVQAVRGLLGSSREYTLADTFWGLAEGSVWVWLLFDVAK
jgi:hypothetical protein